MQIRADVADQMEIAKRQEKLYGAMRVG